MHKVVLNDDYVKMKEADLIENSEWVKAKIEQLSVIIAWNMLKESFELSNMVYFLRRVGVPEHICTNWIDEFPEEMNNNVNFLSGDRTVAISEFFIKKWNDWKLDSNIE